MKKDSKMTKKILEAVESDSYIELKKKYEMLGYNSKRWLEEHIFDCMMNKWIARLWDFDAKFPLPEYAERAGKFRYIYVLTTHGQTWLDYIRENERFELEQLGSIFNEPVDTSTVQNVYDQFEFEKYWE